MKRSCLLILLAFLTSALADEPLEVIGFGSCLHQNKPQPIWHAVQAQKPDLFLLLGDNIYGDSTDMEVLAARYKRQKEHPVFALLRKTCPYLGVWDDHDYGQNDAGADFPHKQASKELMLEFFDEPKDSPRWTRPGVYASYLSGPEGRRVQILLLDTRWFRSALPRLSDEEAVARHKKTHMGPFGVNTDPDATILGQAQWSWLEKQLMVPAEVRLLCSSIPLIHEESGFETWDNYPAERERLYQLLSRTQANGVIILSGDSHRAELSRVDGKIPYPLWELNASGLTEHARSRPPNKNRIGQMYIGDNYGLVKLNWDLDDPEITLEVRALENELIMQQTLRLSDLKG